MLSRFLLSVPAFFLTFALRTNPAEAARPPGVPSTSAKAAGAEEVYSSGPTSSSYADSPRAGFVQEGRASAGFGSLKVSTSGQTTSNDGSGGTDNSQAGFTDLLMIDSPGLTGQTGTMTFNFSVSGGFQIDSSSSDTSGNFTLDLRIGNAIVFAQAATQGGESVQITNYNGNISYAPFLGTTMTFSTPFTFGETLYLEVDMSAYVSFLPSGDAGASAVADFGNSAYWKGIASVTNPNGTPITNYTLMSGSGTDYIAPIPEPGVGMLLGIGALGMLALRRFRRAA